jgi:hypothetical protein
MLLVQLDVTRNENVVDDEKRGSACVSVCRFISVCVYLQNVYRYCPQDRAGTDAQTHQDSLCLYIKAPI